VIHFLRHTMLTRLDESGVDVFSIMKIAGHSSVKASERYVHPSSETVERAFARLHEFNEAAIKHLPATLMGSKTQVSESTGQQVLSDQIITSHAPVAQVDRATVS
jgi:hypothetical protein